MTGCPPPGWAQENEELLKLLICDSIGALRVGHWVNSLNKLIKLFRGQKEYLAFFAEPIPVSSQNDDIVFNEEIENNPNQFLCISFVLI